MAFQTQVNKIQALGNVGQISKGHHDYLNVVSGIVADENVKVGGFIQAVANPTNENEVKGASGVAITGDILGVVVRDSLKNQNSISESLTLEKGTNCLILNVGSIFIECEGEAKKGQYVFLKTDDGSLVFDNSSTKASHTYTGFRVSKGNASGKGIIEITTARA